MPNTISNPNANYTAGATQTNTGAGTYNAANANPVYTPGYTAPATTSINSSSIAPATPITPVQPATTPTYPVATLGAPVTPPLQATPEQNQQSGLLKQLTDLGNQDAGKAQYTSDQYKALGFGMTYDANGNVVPDAGTADLMAKLTGLKNEALAIPLQGENSATGVRSEAGQAPLTAAAQRTNAIESLQVSSTIDAINGNLQTAQAKVNQAVIQKYGPIEAQMTALKANLANIIADPQTSIDEKNAATAQNDAVAAQTAQIAQEKSDFKTGQAMAIAAVVNNPQDPAAQQASQQAMALDPSDPQYLQKVSALVSKYQTDPLATQKTLLDMQSTRADIAYKNAQIAKMSADAKDTGLDPSQLLAYAQEYASTGKIPTGLPKGAFGAVAEYAKGAPKPDGTVVSSSTGVVPSNVTPTQIDGLGALKDLSNKLNQLDTMYNNTTMVSPLSQQTQYTDLKNEIVDLLARARSGAALTESEVANYSSKLPTLRGTTTPGIGVTSTQRITDLNNSIQGKLNTSLAAHNVVMVGYSKVNVGGQQYTVGQTVTNDKGQTGTVNADGSITLQ